MKWISCASGHSTHVKPMRSSGLGKEQLTLQVFGVVKSSAQRPGQTVRGCTLVRKTEIEIRMRPGEEG